VGKQYSAVDSLIFCNSQLLHGEAAAIFAGAYTTSHHKSTLLIGCMFSFYNAGSGTNQSNHMYKLGPVHQGILERGVKTGSDSYLMLEARAGAFSLILGHHEAHFDGSDLPFSYILAKNGDSELIPAVNFQTVGTQRDSQKWKKRDKRKGDTLEYINFDLLNPYLINKVRNGISVLEKLSEKSSEYHSYKGLKIKDIFLKKGIEIYKMAIVCYLGQKLLEFETLKAENETAKRQWVDLAGLIIPQNVLNDILSKIEKITDIKIVNDLFLNFYKNYAHYEQAFVYDLLQEFFPDKTLSEILAIYAENLQRFTNAIVSDAEKEFNAASMVGFGIDGGRETQQADFKYVRGGIEENAFVVEVVKKSKKELNSINEFVQKEQAYNAD
jgi:hypothetical protein